MTVTAKELVAQAMAHIREIEATEVHQRLGEEVVVIDVREPAEFAGGRAPGAINIPRGVLEFQVETHPALVHRAHPALTDRQRTIFLYCHTGGRSAMAASTLKDMGFTDVYSLRGGFVAWQRAGLPIEQ